MAMSCLDQTGAERGRVRLIGSGATRFGLLYRIAPVALLLDPGLVVELECAVVLDETLHLR